MPEKSVIEQPMLHARDGREVDAVLEHVRQALIGLQFGTVALTVQDGVVVQVDRVERKRFRRGER